MEPKRPHSVMPLLVALVLLVLPLLYIGSYAALVIPKGRFVHDPNGSLAGHVHSDDWDFRYRGRVERYRVASAWSQRIFWPLEQIDRLLRPVPWNDTPDPPEVERYFSDE